MKSFILVIPLIVLGLFSNAQTDLEFRNEIRAPDSWELILEYHSQDKTITSGIMESYRSNNYANLKSEYSAFCDCKTRWTDMAEKLEIPATAAYIPQQFNLNCDEGSTLISLLRKFSNDKDETELVNELHRLWTEYGNSESSFNSMIYRIRIFMRLIENLDINCTDKRDHIVQEGETLYRLSIKYGVSVESIQAANKLGESTSIQSGQHLSIP